MSDGQNDIAFPDILTKCIKLIELQGYVASIVYWSVRKDFLLKVNRNKQDLSG